MSDRPGGPAREAGEAADDPAPPETRETAGIASPSPRDPADSVPVEPKEAVAVQIQSARRVEFSGPLPHPELFRAYEDTLPGAADRILAMAEGEQDSRHSRENRGQWMAFLVALLALVGGMALVYFDKSVEGLTAMILPIAIIIGIFVTSKRRRAAPPQSASDRGDPVQQVRLPTPPPDPPE